MRMKIFEKLSPKFKRFFNKNLGRCPRYTAFTLAEVLIVLAIIGVVAALTLPILIANYQKQQFVTALQNEYSAFSQATTLIRENNGGAIDNAFDGSVDNVLAAYKKYMSFSKSCQLGEYGCWHKVNNWHYLQGDSYPWDPVQGFKSAILNDGTLVISTEQYDGCNHWNVADAQGNDIECASIAIDVNGFKGPNTLGRDIFSFYISKNGLIADGMPHTRDENWDYHCNPGATTVQGIGDGCAGKVLIEGKMNY